ncbi:MAG: hypothetical protein LR015_05655 [Verrucomicrobia bacterium]|nr:hypothetical protein [Verrucomicrobiota bacterium]
MSVLDAKIIALGRCKRTEYLPCILNKARTLPEKTEFSHYRALAEALVAMNCAQAVPVLEELLNRPGVRGHAIQSIQARLTTATADANETSFRNEALIELCLTSAIIQLDPTSATALKVLQEYRNDVRGTVRALRQQFNATQVVDREMHR